jgi:hypothetical protein
MKATEKALKPIASPKAITARPLVKVFVPITIIDLRIRAVILARRPDFCLL